MIEIFKNILCLLVLVTVFTSCEKSNTVDTVVEKEPVNTPAMAKGTLPENGEPCADVEPIPGDPLKVSVLFQWTSSEFAENYEIRVFESNNEVYVETLTSLKATVALDRGKSYSWSITAKNGDGETVSNTFSFTTPGEPIGNYVPYAAVISVEFDVETSEMNVSWAGSDEDGDTLIYDVVIKEDEGIRMKVSNLFSDSLDAMPFNPTSVYSVVVTSKDNSGNFSISQYHAVAPY